MDSEIFPKRLRVNDSETEGHVEEQTHGEDAKSVSERGKENDKNPILNETPAAGPSNTNSLAAGNEPNDETTSKIFKLDVDCFDEIFEYLTMKDILSFGNTCKTAQKLVADYNKQHFSGYCYELEEDGIHFYCTATGTRTPAVNQFVIRIGIEIGWFQPLYMMLSELDEFTSLKHITLTEIGYSGDLDYGRTEGMMGGMESIYLRSCSATFVNQCMETCDDCERISLRGFNLEDFFDSGTPYPWLVWTYPKLKHFEFISSKESPFDGLNGFLENNENIRTFSTNGQFLWINRHQFLNSSAKLDVLEIRMTRVSRGYPADEFGDDETRMPTICQLINQLFERGFYQRLHFYIDSDYVITRIDDVASLKGLEKLYIWDFAPSFTLKPLTIVKELIILRGIKNIDLEQLTAEQCARLNHLYLRSESFDDMLPFVRKMENLHKLTLLPSKYFDIDLVALNKLHEKSGARRKLIVYAPDKVFVDTKRTTPNGNICLSSVELRRGEELGDFLEREIK